MTRHSRTHTWRPTGLARTGTSWLLCGALLFGCTNSEEEEPPTPGEDTSPDSTPEPDVETPDVEEPDAPEPDVPDTDVPDTDTPDIDPPAPVQASAASIAPSGNLATSARFQLVSTTGGGQPIATSPRFLLQTSTTSVTTPAHAAVGE